MIPRLASLASSATSHCARSAASPATRNPCWRESQCDNDLWARHFSPRRSAPSWQIICRRALRQNARLLDGIFEIALDQFSLHPPAQEIGPEKLTVRCRVLGKAAGAPQFAGKAAERIVDQTHHRFRNVFEAQPPTTGIVRMRPGVMVEDHPEFVACKVSQVPDDRDQHAFDSFLVQRTAEMMMIDDVGALLWPQHDRDHVFAEVFPFLIVVVLAPVPAFFLDLAHPDGDLGGAKG